MARKQRRIVACPAESNEPRRREWLLALGLVAVVVVAYVPAIRGGFIWDDDHYVYANSNLTRPDGLGRIWFEPRTSPQYYPLVFTTFWVEHQLWGDAPLGYHLVNVLVHAGSSLLLWRLLRKLEIPGAPFAAALFALHPVQVESVAWVTERKNVLSGFFYLLAALTYFQSDERPSARRSPAYMAALVFYVCAVLSKTVAGSLPAAILLVIWWKRGSVKWRDVAALLPFFVIGLLGGTATAWLEKQHVGAYGPDFELSILQRLLIAGRALWFYLGKLLWPNPLIFIYPRWHVTPSDAWQWAFPVAALAIVVSCIALRSRWGRGPLVACLFFGGTLLPALGFVNVYPMRFSFVADHFQYLASIGPLTLISSWLARTSTRLSGATTNLLAVALFAILTTLTWQQCRTYADEETLWEDVVAHNPSAWIAHNNLGFSAAMRGQIDQAIRYLTESVRINPYSTEGRSNLGSLLLKQGRLEEARRHLTEAVRLEPNFADAHSNLGVVALHEDKRDEAVSHFRDALRLDPWNFSVRFNLGCTLIKLGRLDEAVEHLTAAVRIEPTNAEARDNLQKATEERLRKR